MANFKTHIQIATLTSGAAATALLANGDLSHSEALCCWLVGSFAGILPDIDSDNSHCLAILFWLAGLLGSATAILQLIDTLPFAQIFAIASVLFLSIHFIVRPVFERLTIHRGVFHSVLGSALFSFIVVNAAHGLGAVAALSWWLGAFCLLGCITHLVLDEVYAVDFMGAELKSSFGSALKLYDYQNYWSLTLMLTLCGGLLFYAPDVPQSWARELDKLTSLIPK